MGWVVLNFADCPDRWRVLYSRVGCLLALHMFDDPLSLAMTVLLPAVRVATQDAAPGQECLPALYIMWWCVLRAADHAEGLQWAAAKSCHRLR
jgi:hypothetical protein